MLPFLFGFVVLTAAMFAFFGWRGLVIAAGVLILLVGDGVIFN
jgi:hypothetical protein